MNSLTESKRFRNINCALYRLLCYVYILLIAWYCYCSRLKISIKSHELHDKCSVSKLITARINHNFSKVNNKQLSPNCCVDFTFCVTIFSITTSLIVCLKVLEKTCDLLTEFFLRSSSKMNQFCVLFVFNLLIVSNCSVALTVKKAAAETPPEPDDDFDIGLSESEQKQIGIEFIEEREISRKKE